MCFHSRSDSGEINKFDVVDSTYPWVREAQGSRLRGGGSFETLVV